MDSPRDRLVVGHAGAVSLRPVRPDTPKGASARHRAARRHRGLVTVAMALAVASTVSLIGVQLHHPPGALSSVAESQGPGWQGHGSTGGGESGGVPAVGHDSLRPGDPAQHPHDHWRRVLQRLDMARATAWRRGRPAGLLEVFVPGSELLARDKRRMLAYIERGLVVRGVRLSFGEIGVVRRDAGTVFLRVVDRLLRARVLTPNGMERSLPRDQASRHTLRLERQGDQWRLAAVLRRR